MDHHLYMSTFFITILFNTQASDDDDIDRLNRKYTVYLLIALAVISASRLFMNITSLISCWNRANFHSAYIKYTNYICFITNTYQLDTNEQIPNSINERKARVLNYYQWTPFIILLMALFFYLPRLFWRTLSVRSGIDLLDIIDAAGETKTVKDFDDRDQLIKYMVDTIDMYVDDARRHSDAEKRQRSLIQKFFQLLCCMTGKFLGNYFITLYIFIKICYIFNVIFQIWLLSVFLGTNFLRFGYESVKLFRHGLNQPESKYFPRETFCDFFVREPLRGGEPMQRITVQCVLTVNLFNQQIFTLLWIWYVFVLICNVYALISWSIRLGSSSRQYEFIHTRLARTSRPGLLTDDNDDNSIGDIHLQASSEPQINPSIDSQITESATPAITKFLKSALKPSKTTNDESIVITNKNLQHIPIPQPRPSAINSMSKSMTLANNDSPQIFNSDSSNGSSQTKPSMSTSLYSSLLPSNTLEHKNITNSVESIPSSSMPPVLARTGKVTGGTRVLPILDPNTDAPPIKLRHYHAEKKVPHGVNPPSTETTTTATTSDTVNNSTVDVPATASSPSTPHTDDQNEQYKRLSVKERARMLTTTLPVMTPVDKKVLTSTNTTTISSQPPPYTPRTYRRIIEQVNLFC
ncbi:unnamed protein product [Adineta steineri]|uniref:Innexin n=2 Tax=Adineta steineri TaxID=433720 RepID=A0A813Z282_9BILA|nr:unnamed protein product [Adineta steineri]